MYDDINTTSTDSISLNSNIDNTQNRSTPRIIYGNPMDTLGLFMPIVGLTSINNIYYGIFNYKIKEIDNLSITSEVGFTNGSDFLFFSNIQKNNYFVDIELEKYPINQYILGSDNSIKTKSNKHINANSKKIEVKKNINDLFYIGLFGENIQNEDEDGKRVYKYILNDTEIDNNPDDLFCGIHLNYTKENEQLKNNTSFIKSNGKKGQIDLKYNFNKNNNFVTYSIAGSSLYNIPNSKSIVALNMRYRGINGDYPLHKGLNMGGYNNTRGYTNGSLGTAEKILETTLELRFKLNKSKKHQLWGHLFIDYADDFNSQNDVYAKYNITDEQVTKQGDGYSIGLGIAYFLMDCIKMPDGTEIEQCLLPGPLCLNYILNDNGQDVTNPIGIDYHNYFY